MFKGLTLLDFMHLVNWYVSVAHDRQLSLDFLLCEIQIVHRIFWFPVSEVA